MPEQDKPNRNYVVAGAPSLLDEKGARKLLPNHYTIAGYATKKDIQRKTVYTAIKAGRIIPDLVGAGEEQFIDWEKYGTLEFYKPNRDANGEKKT